jgi:MFS family permease
MNLLMAGTPLAMEICKFPFSDTAIVLEWHVIGMFAPGFFTGNLIKKFGSQMIMGIGVFLIFVSIGILQLGSGFYHFLFALALLGLGWNFVFTAATTLAITTYRPEEKNKAQAIVNFFVFGTMAFSSIGSGAIIISGGWNILTLGSLIPATVMALALVYLYFHQRKNIPAIA